MSAPDPPPPPHDFWQEIVPAGTFEASPPGGHRHLFSVGLPDGRQIALPIRERPGGEEALASLIINQASFEVLGTFAAELARLVAPFAPDIVVGLPTLGLTLATETARRLGHSRLVPLGTSRLLWYLDDLSMPMSSVTSPDQEKRLYLDPRMIPLLEGRRILLVDDVLSTGASMAAGIGVLRLAGVRPVAIGAAMLQTDRWRAALAGIDPALPEKVLGVISTPRLVRTAEGGWQPGDETI